MYPAVFLDRDGVLCVEKGYVDKLEKLEIFSYAKRCVDILHQKGFLVICVTNQSAVARGMMKENMLQEINRYLILETGVDALYYCPHHPNGIGKYRVLCSCRKPETGMVESAIMEYRIDRNKSYLVGDRASDILCGKAVGMKTVLLESGYGTLRLEQPVRPDFIFDDLEAFVKNLGV